MNGKKSVLWRALILGAATCGLMLGAATGVEQPATLGGGGAASDGSPRIHESATSTGERKASSGASVDPMAARAALTGDSDARARRLGTAGAGILHGGPELGLPTSPSSRPGATQVGRECIIDQNQPSDTTYMAGFTQTDLAQSFQQAHDNICGAGIKLHTAGEAGYVTIGLWDALPNNGGHLLASATDWGVPDSFFDVFWAPVQIEPGVTYYLTFDSDTNMGIRGDTGDPYPYGHVYANTGYQPYPSYDYTFRTYYQDNYLPDCLLDQNQPSDPVCMAAFYQPDLAQSFKQSHDTICGAGLKFREDWGTGGNVYIELWDALPNAGGRMLASGFEYGSPGTWVDVYWPRVPITSGATYYLVFYGDDTSMCVAGDTNNPYPHGMVFANEGYQPIPNFDYTFRTYYDETPGGPKYLQPVDCDGSMYYSNLNSSYSPWLRYDDFICNQTGEITQVSFWGGMTNDDPTANISSISIEFYEWIPDGPCGFLPGPLLCSYVIPAAQLSYVYECDWLGSHDIYKYTADLPNPCFQEQGQRFVLRIAATLNDPDGAILMWTTSTITAGTAAASYRYDDQYWQCGPDDQAFELVTAPVHGKYAQPVNCEGPGYYSNLNSNINDFLRFDDFICNQTGGIERVVFWGGMWQDCGPKENLAAVRINFREWLPDGPCGFLPGPLLCSYTIPADELAVQFDCDDNVPHFRYTANLPEPCFQEEGQHFVLMIAGIVEDPDVSCIFYWSESTVQYGTEGGSYSDTYDWVCQGVDNAFELYTEPSGKFEQPPNCEDVVYFSNINSNINPWFRFDDFVCQQTGDINRIEFWGCGFDLDQWYSCGLPHIDSFWITFYKWEPGGPCEWQPGAQLCSYQIPMAEVEYQYECTGPNGDYFKFTVDLPEPCYQEEGQHFSLFIAGVMPDPDDPCIFGWLTTDQVNWSEAASYHRTDDYWSCGGPDQAFALYTVEDECPADVNDDGVVNIDDLFAVLGHWGEGPGKFDVNGDGTVNIDDIFAILGAWGPC